MTSLQKKIIAIRSGEHVASPHLVSLQHNSLHLVNGIQPRTEPAKLLPPTTTPTIKIDLNQMAPSAPSAPPERTPIPEKKPPSTARAHKSSRWHLPRIAAPKKAALAFVAAALLIVSPLKALTTFEQLRTVKASVVELRDLPSVSFENAGEQVHAALRTLHAANTNLQAISPVEEFVLKNTPWLGKQYGAANRLVAAGEHVSLAAASYLQLFKTLRAQNTAPLLERLQLFFDGNRAVAQDLKTAADLVRPIDPTTLDSEQQKFVTEAKAAVLALSHDAEYLGAAGPIIMSALGSAAPRRYLMVFQNPAELRPTGGFIGSYALIDIEDGMIKKLTVPAGGSYDLQGALRLHLQAPLPLHMINPRWEFQDSNWFPDFPTSAQKLMWFLEKSQGPSVDGVIAVNSSILPELLQVVGTVTIAGRKDITADNALITVRQEIDAVKNTSQPKQIITDLADSLITTLQNSRPEHFMPLVTVLLKGLEQREIQIYARDTAIQSQLAEFGWDGALRDNPNGDFLNVITTNIGGQKTDAVVEQQIDHQAEITTDGTVTITVQITRKQKLSNAPLEGAPNISYVRVYVPSGSKLLSARGFTFPPEALFRAGENWEKTDTDLTRIEQELGVDKDSGTRLTNEFAHTVFGNWLITQPGGVASGELKYELPFKVAPADRSAWETKLDSLTNNPATVHYSLLAQRQSGQSPTQFSSRILLPPGWRPAWSTDQRATLAENGSLLQVPFSTDIYYGIAASIN